jgi:PTH1 family peptidyl-tRNA hydrolase
MDMRKYRAFCGKGMIEGQRVFLMKPQTYMNLSGESIIQAVNFFQADPETELLVIYDDISLDVGQLRIRKKGSAGGHNGIKSIIAHLGTQNFPRVKVGVGEKPKDYDLADYVLGHFSKAEQEIMEDAAKEAVRAVAMIVAGEMEAAMNEFNRKKKE